MKNAGAVLAAVRGRAHAIEQHLEAGLLRTDLVKVLGNEDLVECDPAPLQFGEDGREPLRVLVKKRQLGALGSPHFG